jgi:hypothetical protein
LLLLLLSLLVPLLHQQIPAYSLPLSHQCRCCCCHQRSLQLACLALPHWHLLLLLLLQELQQQLLLRAAPQGCHSQQCQMLM